jgi:hypothetical protein
MLRILAEGRISVRSITPYLQLPENAVSVILSRDIEGVTSEV